MIVQFAVAVYKKKCNEYFYLNDLIKGTVSTIPNDPLCKEVNAMFFELRLYTAHTEIEAEYKRVSTSLHTHISLLNEHKKVLQGSVA